jgi:hypothetical protein
MGSTADPLPFSSRSEDSSHSEHLASVSGRDAAAAPIGYPVDPGPPKDFHDDALLRTLSRESTAAVICRIDGLRDIMAGSTDPDIFYAATCEAFEVLKGPLRPGPFRFIWQVERDSRLPPLGSDLLVYLKTRKEPLPQEPNLRWTALDTGVLRYTERLKIDVHKSGLFRE